jgi:hypothetical protein
MEHNSGAIVEKTCRYFLHRDCSSSGNGMELLENIKMNWHGSKIAWFQAMIFFSLPSVAGQSIGADYE